MSTPFSYAQAAKGQFTAKPAAPQSVSSQAASTTSSQSQVGTVGTTTNTPSVAASTTSNDNDANENAVEPSESSSKSNAGSTMQPAKEEESSAEIAPEEASQPIVQETKQVADTWVPSTERRGMGPNSSSTRSSDIVETKKSRKSKKARGDKDLEQDPSVEKDKDSEAPKVELSEAPIPAVNPWTQRAALQQKSTPAQSSTPSRAATAGGNASPATTALFSSVEAKSRPALNNDAESTISHGRPAPNGVKSQRRGNEPVRDGSDQAGRRSAPRGSRIGDKGERRVGEPLPVVSDVHLWPTVESAITGSKAQDKTDKPQEKEETKEESGPKEKTKWVPVPYVPTVNFQTPLPTRGGRGGRPAGSRGGRDTGVRGNHASGSSVDRSQAAAMKSAGGSHDGAVNGQAASAASHMVNRASVDNSGAREMNKSSAGMTAEAVKSSADPSPSINGKDGLSKQSQGESNGSALNQQQSSGAPTGSDLRIESSSWVADQSKESLFPSAKESKHHSNNRNEGGSRSRGGNRGRGNHQGANGHHPAYSASGQSFGMPPRQNSYPANFAVLFGNQYPGPNTGHGHRGSNRHNSTSSNYFRQPQTSGARISPAQTSSNQYDMSLHPASNFPSYGAPYGFTDGSSILDLVKGQLEFYFSVDNLCKDTFLRRHMDSQGFVFIEVIAGFRRMQNMTTNIDVIRVACEDNPEVEIVIGADDNRTRLRRRHGWEAWVYPPGQRHESVNYDNGPSNCYYYSRHAYGLYQAATHGAYPLDSPPMFSPNGVDAQFAPYMNGATYVQAMGNGINGMNGVHSQAPVGESQLSAEVPEFSPSGAMGASDLGSAAPGRDSAKVGQHTTGVNGEAAPLTNGTHEEIAQPYQPPYTNGVGDAVEAEI
ncbi:uncharacterized protein BCR38DRAFT_484099 [Pseudomassariella vexata]|uniref:HTH La-type RNA-binding domain-containing protein n=1 Tax=Pseudomassariella vexata TaxID=1141098 RepID=A0A1Y2E4W6_9PEZI|nr:uncharacterized protein BCR38DRAFT_484099 [Pseudomassariella vexata]ORY66477.1 hypothetical protein BCR38DRAFT_484099 [Pseudomassariella vexata]